MKLASKYKDWKGPLNLADFEQLELNDESIVWFPALCPNNLQEPTNCDHQPIFLSEFEKLDQKPPVQIFYKEKNLNYILQRIALWTAILGLVTAIFTFAKEFLSDKKKETSMIVLCKNCDCNCDYEDVPGEANGKKAVFRIAYLTQEKRWKYSSELELNDGTLLAYNIKENLPNFPNFGNALGLIAVGTASQEGSDTQKEELRADRRADAILFNIRINVIAKNKELYKLNLGQYLDKKNLTTLETAYQRRVIIVGIMQKDSTMNLAELKTALKNGLNDSEGLDYDTEKYSNFELTRQN